MGEPFAVRDPEEWLRAQRRRTEDLLAKAEQAKTDLAANTVTHTSKDRMVTVTVNPGGALDALTIAPEAQGMRVGALANLIVHTYRQATTKAADRTLEIMAGLSGGDDSAAVEFVRETLPPRVEADTEDQRPDDAVNFTTPDDPPAAPPPAPKRAPRRQRDDEVAEDDYGNINWTDPR